MGIVLTALAAESLIASCGALRDASDSEIDDTDRQAFAEAQRRARLLRLRLGTVGNVKRVPDEWERGARRAAA